MRYSLLLNETLVTYRIINISYEKNPTLIEQTNSSISKFKELIRSYNVAIIRSLHIFTHFHNTNTLC